MRVSIPTPNLGDGNRDVRYFHARLTVSALFRGYVEIVEAAHGRLKKEQLDDSEEDWEHGRPNPDLVEPTENGKW
eukprot:9167882-Alexandrium_andersonii.AAC.1